MASWTALAELPGRAAWPRRARLGARLLAPGWAGPAERASKLPAVNRTARWLLPTVLALLVLGVLVGAVLH
jgi:hypothetical protein